MIDTNIQLTDLEQRIFDTLLAARHHKGLSTVMRCAGGWVRDKLLRRESKDIDIALDDMSGVKFAECVNEYLEHQGEPAASIGVIAANPDQSKHLETATLRVHGEALDLVNLRSEHYTAESRIPIIEVGTPQQDAERRDFTINSLFYNLNTGAVEDFTGQGLRDLERGIIRTPMEPRTTFLDDPLRVLRAVRFASRYCFVMVDELKAAAASEEVRGMLAKKIARERVGVEMAGCLQGPHPVLSMQHLQELQAFGIVFQAPDAAAAQLGPEYGRACVLALELAHPLLLARGVQTTDDERRVGCTTALLLPLRAVAVPLKKNKSEWLPRHIILNSLKWKARDGDQVTLLHRELPCLCHISDKLQGLSDEQLQNAAATAALRSELGNCLSRLKELAPLAVALFPLLFHPAAVALGGAEQPQQEQVGRRDMSADDMLGTSARLDRVVDLWGLRGCHNWPALVGGKQIVALLGLGKPGPVVGSLTAAAREWQFAHPQYHPDALAGMNKSDMPPTPLVEFLQLKYKALSVDKEKTG